VAAPSPPVPPYPAPAAAETAAESADKPAAPDPRAREAKAGALAQGRGVPRDRGQAYLLYASLGDAAAGKKKPALEAKKQAMLEEIINSRDTTAGPAILADLGKRAKRDGGYAYFLGLVNACALPTPDVPAARAAYTLALKDKRIRPAAQAALDRQGGWCPGSQ
jgi:hypothetical protein